MNSTWHTTIQICLNFFKCVCLQQQQQSLIPKIVGLGWSAIIFNELIGGHSHTSKKKVKKKKKVITEVSCQSNKFTEVSNLLIHLASSQSSKLCVSCNLKKKKIIWKLWNNLYNYLDCQFHKSPRSTQIHIYQPEQQFHS